MLQLIHEAWLGYILSLAFFTREDCDLRVYIPCMSCHPILLSSLSEKEKSNSTKVSNSIIYFYLPLLLVFFYLCTTTPALTTVQYTVTVYGKKRKEDRKVVGLLSFLFIMQNILESFHFARDATEKLRFYLVYTMETNGPL